MAQLTPASPTQPTQSASTPNAGEVELDRYLGEPLIPRTSNMPTWWNENRDRFPVLASMARKYLGAPPSSVPSERLFSAAGGVITDQRSRLLPENAEMLIFLKYNTDLIQS
jgi:hAT family C-terminal dimerisation region